jgi:hypothetical protein
MLLPHYSLTKKEKQEPIPFLLKNCLFFILTSSVNWMKKDFPFSCYIIKTLLRFWQEEFFIFSKSLFMLLSLTLIELHFLHARYAETYQPAALRSFDSRRLLIYANRGRVWQGCRKHIRRASASWQ